MTEQPWVMLHSEDYEDHLIGNREGIRLLRNALDQTLKDPDFKMPEELHTDFHGILISDEEFENSEKNYSGGVVSWGLGIFFFLWLLALPILGIVFIGKSIF